MPGATPEPVSFILQHLAALRFRNLFLIAAALFVADLSIPDVIPFIDELLLGILTMIFWSWRRPRTGPVIEREGD